MDCAISLLLENVNNRRKLYIGRSLPLQESPSAVAVNAVAIAAEVATSVQKEVVTMNLALVIRVEVPTMYKVMLLLVVIEESTLVICQIDGNSSLVVLDWPIPAIYQVINKGIITKIDQPPKALSLNRCFKSTFLWWIRATWRLSDSTRSWHVSPLFYIIVHVCVRYNV